MASIYAVRIPWVKELIGSPVVDSKIPSRKAVDALSAQKCSSLEKPPTLAVTEGLGAAGSTLPAAKAVSVDEAACKYTVTIRP
jgi:hypothetical protein